MTQIPLVTALLPVKNYDPVFLRRALDSMHSQSSPRWRLIVICEPEDLTHFSDLLRGDLVDPRIKLEASQGERMEGALNTGIRAADTDFCGFLLGDDMWAPQAIEVLEREIESHPSVDFFHSARLKVDEQDRPLGTPWYGKKDVRTEDFLRAAPVKHLLCFRREMALAIGGMDESLWSGDDYDFPWSMADHGASFRAVDEVLYLYREHRRFPRLSTDVPHGDRWRDSVRMWRKHGAGRGFPGRLLVWISTRHARRKGLRKADRPSRAPLEPRPRAKR